MNSDRIKQLQNFLRETPDDPFLLYALALEFLENNPPESARLFDRLLHEFPEYLPTYYHAAAFFYSRGESRKTDEIYRKGIALAKVQQASLALRELQSAYSQFQFEEEG